MPPSAAIDLAFLASLSIARQRDDKGDRCASAKEEGRGADENGPTARIIQDDRHIDHPPTLLRGRVFYPDSTTFNRLLTRCNRLFTRALLREARISAAFGRDSTDVTEFRTGASVGGGDQAPRRICGLFKGNYKGMDGRIQIP
jgi:hypothetical protein